MSQSLMCIVLLQKKYTVCSAVQVYLTSQVWNASICWIRGSRELGGRLRERYRRKHQENESQRLDEERPLRGVSAMDGWRRTCPLKEWLDLAMPASSLPSQEQCQWSSGTEARVPYTDKVTGRVGG